MQIIKKPLVTLLTVCIGLTHTVWPAYAANSTESQDAAPAINLPSFGTVMGADLSVLEERQYGEEIMRHIRADESFMTDPESTDYLNRLGYRLIAASPTQPYNFLFFPIRDKSLNAFALPGGFIAAHSGLVVAAQSESELAGVLSHEIGHVTQRHIARMIEQSKGSLAMTIGSILLAILASRAGGSSGGDAAVATIMGTQAALLQQQLGFSRNAEREADRVGLSSLVNAGFDPKGMEDFFARLQQNNRYYETTSSAYLSTHPLTSERISDMQGRTRLMGKVEHHSSLDFYLIQARLRVLQETRVDAWLQAVKHFNAELKKPLRTERIIALHYGLAVAYQKLGRHKEALSAIRQSIALASGSNVYLERTLAQCEFSLAKTPDQKAQAINTAKLSARQHEYSTLAAENYAELLFQAGKHQDVIRFLRRQRALSVQDPDYYAMLARSYHALEKHSLAFKCTGDMYAMLGNSKAALYQYDLAQRSNDADFYTMSEIDAKLREYRRKITEQRK